MHIALIVLQILSTPFPHFIGYLHHHFPFSLSCILNWSTPFYHWVCSFLSSYTWHLCFQSSHLLSNVISKRVIPVFVCIALTSFVRTVAHRRYTILKTMSGIPPFVFELNNLSRHVYVALLGSQIVLFVCTMLLRSQSWTRVGWTGPAFLNYGHFKYTTLPFRLHHTLNRVYFVDLFHHWAKYCSFDTLMWTNT